MTQFGMNFKSFQQSFINTEKIIDKAERAKVRPLVRSGALVRTIARRSIRKRKKSAQPGSPPSAHAGHLRRKIFFAPDATRGSVVIGPELFNTSPIDIVNTQPATETLEYGGKIGIREVYDKGQWKRRSLVKNLRGKRKRIRYVTVKARQYMGPGFDQALPQLNEFWRNSIRG